MWLCFCVCISLTFRRSDRKKTRHLLSQIIKSFAEWCKDDIFGLQSVGRAKHDKWFGRDWKRQALWFVRYKNMRWQMIRYPLFRGSRKNGLFWGNSIWNWYLNWMQFVLKHRRLKPKRNWLKSMPIVNINFMIRYFNHKKNCIFLFYFSYSN